METDNTVRYAARANGSQSKHVTKVDLDETYRRIHQSKRSSKQFRKNFVKKVTGKVLLSELEKIRWITTTN